MMCGYLGLAGDWEPTRVLFKRLAQMTSAGGLLIGDSVDPTSDDPDDVVYEGRERKGWVPSGTRPAAAPLRRPRDTVVGPDQLPTHGHRSAR